jgi:hypothetical protein
MDFDVASVEGEAQLQAYMTRQYLVVLATSESPERFFSHVGHVQTDFRGRLLDTTMIDLMWAKQEP